MNYGQELKVLKRKRFTLEELVDYSARLAPQFSGKQTRYKVTDTPAKRTIRYYMQAGLIDKPERSGRHAMFSYRHLLQVLVVKKLQNEFFSLRKITEVTSVSSDNDLEKILIAQAPTNPEKYLPAIVRTGVSLSVPAPVPPPETGWTYCRKFKIHDQLELHVNEDFDLLDPNVDLDVINARIINALSLLSLSGSDWRRFESSGLSERREPDRGLFFAPAPPVASMSGATVVLITEGGLVPKGNPDRLEVSRATRFLKYNIEGVADLKADVFESIDKGWDTAHVNADPDRLVPLDVMRELEQKRLFGKIHEYFYTTTGVGMDVDAAREIGRNMARDLKRTGVSACIMTAT